MNFAILPKFRNPSFYFVSDELMQILCTLPQDAQPSGYIKWCTICIPLRNCPHKLLYNVTFAHRFLRAR